MKRERSIYYRAKFVTSFIKFEGCSDRQKILLLSRKALHITSDLTDYIQMLKRDSAQWHGTKQLVEKLCDLSIKRGEQCMPIQRTHILLVEVSEYYVKLKYSCLRSRRALTLFNDVLLRTRKALSP